MDRKSTRATGYEKLTEDDIRNYILSYGARGLGADEDEIIERLEQEPLETYVDGELKFYQVKGDERRWLEYKGSKIAWCSTEKRSRTDEYIAQIIEGMSGSEKGFDDVAAEILGSNRTNMTPYDLKKFTEDDQFPEDLIVGLEEFSADYLPDIDKDNQE